MLNICENILKKHSETQLSGTPMVIKPTNIDIQNFYF